MNKQDWVEYFTAINGRVPSAEEFMEARENGEFVDDSSSEKVLSQKR